MEDFRPITHSPPVGFLGKIKFYGRMILDFQILTIYRDLKTTVPSFVGNVLDIGCGQSPYKHLLDASWTKYFGIDIADSFQFDYNRSDVIRFNGEDIPFDNDTFDGVICTEVLEHAPNHQKLISEMHRVMKKEARGIITVPWSARCHYIPHDYFRYTPSTLKTLLSNFSEVTVKPRGSDIATIVSKIIVLWFRNLIPRQAWRWIAVPFWVILTPLVALCVMVAQVSLLMNLGSDDDPLGYTVLIKK